MRRLGSRDQQSLTLDEALEQLRQEAVAPDLKRLASAN
jgi:threonyl-tRNA synthetase